MVSIPQIGHSSTNNPNEQGTTGGPLLTKQTTKAVSSAYHMFPKRKCWPHQNALKRVQTTTLTGRIIAMLGPTKRRCYSFMAPCPHPNPLMAKSQRHFTLPSMNACCFWQGPPLEISNGSRLWQHQSLVHAIGEEQNDEGLVSKRQGRKNKIWTSHRFRHRFGKLQPRT